MSWNSGNDYNGPTGRRDKQKIDLNPMGYHMEYPALFFIGLVLFIAAFVNYCLYTFSNQLHKDGPLTMLPGIALIIIGLGMISLPGRGRQSRRNALSERDRYEHDGRY